MITGGSFSSVCVRTGDGTGFQQRRMRSSDAKQIAYSTRGRRAKAVNAAEGYINGAVFEIKDTDGYFRIDVVDERGRRANTQAYFLDEL